MTSLLGSNELTTEEVRKSYDGDSLTKAEHDAIHTLIQNADGSVRNFTEEERKRVARHCRHCRPCFVACVHSQSGE